MRVILVGNYKYDRQESMQRFCSMLEAGLRAVGVTVEVIRPEPEVGRLKPAVSGIGKWLGYLDKFLIFPLRLRRRVVRSKRQSQREVVVHICDHSNAFYTRYLKDVPHLVTCHDLLAVRSARGEILEHPTGWTGKQLQKLILAGLNRAAHVACVSEATKSDFQRLSPLGDHQVSVVPNGLNFPFRSVPEADANMRLRQLLSGGQRSFEIRKGEGAKRYILHVGGNQWYKNRLGVLEIYAELVRRLGGAVGGLVMAGQSFTPEMKRFIELHPDWASNVLEVVNPTSEDLCALYSRAELLLFPSLYEGFGWPIIEAQACGCPVATSNRSPMTWVGGGAGIYFDPDDACAAAEAICVLLADAGGVRSARIAEGLRNAERFSAERMVAEYVTLYQKLI